MWKKATNLGMERAHISSPEPALQVSASNLPPSLGWEDPFSLVQVLGRETHLCHCTFYSSSISLGLPIIAAELLGSTSRRPKLT